MVLYQVYITLLPCGIADGQLVGPDEASRHEYLPPRPVQPGPLYLLGALVTPVHQPVKDKGRRGWLETLLSKYNSEIHSILSKRVKMTSLDGNISSAMDSVVKSRRKSGDSPSV